MPPPPPPAHTMDMPRRHSACIALQLQGVHSGMASMVHSGGTARQRQHTTRAAKRSWRAAKRGAVAGECRCGRAAEEEVLLCYTWRAGRGGGGAHWKRDGNFLPSFGSSTVNSWYFSLLICLLSTRVLVA